MADQQINVDSSAGWAGFWIMIALCSIAFTGSPDLVDAAIYKLCGGDMKACADFAEAARVEK